MRVRYAVTFEFETRPPVTHRGTLEAGKVWTLAHRAVEEASLALHPINWISFVCVVLERLPAEADGPFSGAPLPD